jgi:hypothetical protein
VAILEKFNRKAKIDNESGLSTNPYLQGGRFFNNSGNPNMKLRGLSFLRRPSIDHQVAVFSIYCFHLPQY